VDPKTSSWIAATPDGNDAAGTLFATLYAELHRLAKRELARSGEANSLGVTTLLHEAYLDISRRDGLAFPDRARFMAYAARAMRGLIIEHARNGRAQKRGGRFEITSLSADVVEAQPDARELSQISDALDDLARLDPWLAQIVDLKFFCGFTFAEIAAMRGVSERTAQRDWEKARIHLHRSLRSQVLSE
jgi:RNA polymerase sigma factor (TIGR02999 family)